MIRDFEDFCRELQSCGFSMGGGNAKGIFALIDFDWTVPPQEDNPVRWHTGDPETDPWEWRMRVLEEREDIAYSKLFFKTSGFITKDWYPLFYALRRKGMSFDEIYEQGTLSHAAKRIYDVVSGGETALHEIKAIAGFAREDKSRFDRAMLELQMGMFITISGRRAKKSKYGLDYGWNSTVFSTVESFWEERGFEIPELEPGESYERIKEQILRLNPAAEERTLRKFILG